MSPKLLRMTGAEVISFLEKHQFRRARQKGSHVIMKNNRGEAVVIPLRKGKILGVGILKAILKSVGIAEDEVRK
ncbi:MAG: addiction module toxin, HicA family [Synergistaceae bacterium]|nr:addiction module toxin, HicA family [Synergistaceae bacterium]